MFEMTEQERANAAAFRQRYSGCHNRRVWRDKVTPETEKGKIALEAWKNTQSVRYTCRKAHICRDTLESILDQAGVPFK